MLFAIGRWKAHDYRYMYPILREMLRGLRKCCEASSIEDDQRQKNLKAMDICLHCLDKLIADDFVLETPDSRDARERMQQAEALEKACIEKLFNTMRDNIQFWWR